MNKLRPVAEVWSDYLDGSTQKDAFFRVIQAERDESVRIGRARERSDLADKIGELETWELGLQGHGEVGKFVKAEDVVALSEDSDG